MHLDACVDKFLMQLGRLMGIEDLKKKLPAFNNKTKLEKSEEFKELKEQLAADMGCGRSGHASVKVRGVALSHLSLYRANFSDKRRRRR